MRQVAVNIRRARQEKGLTQEAFARALGVGLRRLQSWEAESGQRIPRYAALERLAEATDHPVSWFYAEHDDTHASVAV